MVDTAALLAAAGLLDFAALPAQAIPLLLGKTLPGGMRSGIICLFPYFSGFYPGRNLSLYALPRDYHSVAKGMLNTAAEKLAAHYPGTSFRTFVDASPIDEVAAAHKAGLGDRGLNGLLIAPGWGQFVFIGCILTDLTVDAISLPARQSPALCDRCGRCVAACPTGALSRDGFDPARCRSDITQKKGELTRWEAEQVALGGFAWGCDHCLLSCSHNRQPDKTPIEAFRRDILPVLTDEAIDQIDDRAYLWRGRETLRRNLRIIAGARGDVGEPTA